MDDRAVLPGPDPTSVRQAAVEACRSGDWERGAVLLQEAAESAPSPELLLDLGFILLALSRHDSASSSFYKAAQLSSNRETILDQIGNMLHIHRRWPEGAQIFASLAVSFPRDFVTHAWLGKFLAENGAWEDSARGLRKALELNPARHDIRTLLGSVLLRTDGYAAAAREFSTVLEHEPDNAEAWHYLGFARSLQGELAGCIEAYRKALRLKPDFSICHSYLLYALHFDPDLPPADLYREHLAWADRYGRTDRTADGPLQNSPDPNRRLKIGYVSGDFRSGVPAHFMQGFLHAHAPDRVQVFYYSDVRTPDQVTAGLAEEQSGWRNVSHLADSELSSRIRSDEIDVLVDLNAHSGSRMRFFAGRHAPVQITYLNYPNTTGLPTMDYRITDPVCNPESERTLLQTEKILRLPDVFCAFQPPSGAPDPGPLPAGGAGAITFGSFSMALKISDFMIELWAQILHRSAGSRMLLHHRFGALEDTQGKIDPVLRARVERTFARHGIDERRLNWVGGLDSAGHAALYRRVDLALDSFPYSGQTTACTALWMGVPVVTLAGETFVSRVSASILTSVGMSGWIAASPEEYIRIAVELAADRSRLRELRAGLRQRMLASPLCDSRRLANQLETAYRQAWQVWCAAHPPR